MNVLSAEELFIEKFKTIADQKKHHVGYRSPITER